MFFIQTATLVEQAKRITQNFRDINEQSFNTTSELCRQQQPIYNRSVSLLIGFIKFKKEEVE